MEIGSGKPNRVSKNLWECRIGIGRMPKERKWAKDAQGGRNGLRMPVSNRMGQGSPNSMNADPMTMLGRCNQVKEKHTTSPKKASKHRLNNTTVGITGWHGWHG